jgi:hypothetical protein
MFKAIDRALLGKLKKKYKTVTSSLYDFIVLGAAV